MGLAKIKQEVNGDLHVARDRYEWRRVAGNWQMLGNDENWFDCAIQDRETRNQVVDFECCLRAYSFEDGPDYPKGRRYGEDIGAFISRLQLSELRKGLKNIFAPVPMKYTYGAALARERAAHTKRLSSPMPWRNDRYIEAAYNAAMTEKRAALEAERNAR